MLLKISELRDKDVISLSDGVRLGNVDDVEMDSDGAKVISAIIMGRPRFFGLLGRDEDIVIPWESITMIGADAILVRVDAPKKSRKKSFMEKWLG